MIGFGKPFDICCGNCGAAIKYGTQWRNTLAKAPVCGALCNDELSKKYTRYILGKDPEEKADG